MAFERYQTLGLDPRATPEAIRRAYYRMVRLHPPEKDPERFKLIRSAYETLNDPKARQEYDALEQHGEEIGQLTMEAEELMGEGEWQEAARRLKHVLVLVPQATAAWNSLGLCQLHCSEFQLATRTYSALTQRAPQIPVYWTNYGAAFHEWATQDNDEYENGLEPETRCRLLKNARQCYRKAVELENFNPSGYLAVARAYADEDRLDEAVKWTERAARCRREDKEDFETLFYLSVLYLRRRELDVIIPLAQRIKLALPENEEARKYAAARFAATALDLHKARIFEPAVVFYEAAREFDPENEQLADLHSAAHLTMQVIEEYERLCADSMVISSVRGFAAFRLADVCGELEGKSEAHQKLMFTELLQGLENTPPAAVRNSIERIKRCYPATYRAGEQAYEQLLQAVGAARRQSTSTSSCFVVTATFGGPFAAEVVACRQFRDEYMAKSPVGLVCIAGYNFIGPRLAKIINRRPELRRVLAPLLGSMIRRLPTWER